MSGGRGAPAVLLVEDNETIRDAFSILLEESGYAVLQADRGAAGIEIAREKSPDLILLDLGLPDMDGLEVARTLSRDSETREIPIVALTGRALETDQEVCLAAGCSAYLTKPIDTTQLLDLLPRFLTGSR